MPNREKPGSGIHVHAELQSSENKIGVVDTFVTNGVPNTCTRTQKVISCFDILPGQLNEMRIRPAIINEHVESSRELIDTVTSSNIVGQFFKASQDNINTLYLTLQSTLAFASMDAITSGAGENKAGTMEYSSSAALQAEWIKSGAAEAVRATFTDTTGVTQDEEFCMQLDLTGVVDDEWRVTLDSTDLTGVSFSLKYAQNKSFEQAKMFFFISDGTNGKSFLLPVGAPSIWQTFEFIESSMTVDAADDGGGIVDMTAITEMGFRIDTRRGGAIAYVDSIAYQGSVVLKLWDCGTSLPVGDGASFNLTDNATQYTELGDRGISGVVVSEVSLPLKGGRQFYHVHGFVAGVATEIPTNTLLTVGNYYAITINYVDTDVGVFGPNTTFSIDYYNNGYAFQTTNESTPITKIPGAAGAGAYSDIMFAILSTQDVYVYQTEITILDASGNETISHTDTEITFHLENSDMEMSLTANDHIVNRTRVEDFSMRPQYLDKGGKIEAYYSSDPLDSARRAEFGARYFYTPPIVNG